MSSWDEEIGKEVHARLMESFGHETEAWATGRVARTSARLNAARLACPVAGVCSHPLTAEILWMQQMVAFTLPGRYVYLSRSLLERIASDDSVALVLAHEMAHHDLGHTRLLHPALERFGKNIGATLGALLRYVERLVYSPEQERAADAYALDLALAAGYGPAACLELFVVLERESLDLGDIDGVFGPDTPSRLWEKMRGYPSLRQRKAALLRRLHDEYGL